MSFPPMTQLVRLRAVHIGGQMETEPHLWVWDLEGCSYTRWGGFLHNRPSGIVYAAPVAVQLPASTYPLLIMWI